MYVVRTPNMKSTILEYFKYANNDAVSDDDNDASDNDGDDGDGDDARKDGDNDEGRDNGVAAAAE